MVREGRACAAARAGEEADDCVCVSSQRVDHLFSNACSAFRRALALRIPFDETLAEVEDYAWAREIQRQGYAIAYAGDAAVFHSHAASSFTTVRRMFYYTYLRMRVDAAPPRGMSDEMEQCG
jgi:GT2 family glycosyltransferase